MGASDALFAERQTSCPICAHSQLARDLTLSRGDGVRLSWSKCKKCGFTFMNPRLLPSEMRKVYASADYWNNAVYKNYLDGEPTRVKNAMNRFRFCARYIPASGALLDIGCSTGFFAAVAHRHGYRVVGIDPAQDMVEYGRRVYGIDLRAQTVEECEFEDGRFDVVSLWGADSQFFDVRASFQRIARWIKPGGWLLLTYQDYDHWIRKFFPKIKQGVNVYYNFTSDSFGRLMRQMNMNIIVHKTDVQITEFHKITRTIKFGVQLLAPLDRFEVKIPTISYKLVVARKVS